jgi:hypothetical protein
MKKQILLIVMTLCAMSAMAVSLPRTSYNVDPINVNSGYTFGVGTTIVNTGLVGSYNGTACTDQGVGLSVYDDTCLNCCAATLCEESARSTNADECMEKLLEQGNMYMWQNCMDDCEGKHVNQKDENGPLDTSVFFLLALIAAYGAFAVYRRKMQEV